MMAYTTNWDNIEAARLKIAFSVYNILKKQNVTDCVCLRIKRILASSFGVTPKNRAYTKLFNLCIDVYDKPVHYAERVKQEEKEDLDSSIKLYSKKDIQDIDSKVYIAMLTILQWRGSMAKAMWKVALDYPLKQFTFLEMCISENCIPWLYSHPMYDDLFDTIFYCIDWYRKGSCRTCGKTKNKMKNPIRCLECSKVVFCNKMCKITTLKDVITGHYAIECGLLK